MQKKKIEENNRMGKARDLFKKIGDIKGTFHSRMGTIKDRGSKDQQKQKRFRRSGKNTQKTNTKKDPNDPDNHNGVVTLLELNILECEVRWAVGSITTNKASGGDRIPAELFKVLKYDVSNATLNMSANLENSTVATGLEKVSFHSNPKEGQCQRIFNLPYNCAHFPC